MRRYSVVVTEKVLKRYEVDARSGQEAAMKVGQLLGDGDAEPLETQVVDITLSKPTVVTVAPPTLDLNAVGDG